MNKYIGSIRNARRDAVAQAIADMLADEYVMTHKASGQWTSPWQGNPEFLELVTKIRKVMDQAYAQA